MKNYAKLQLVGIKNQKPFYIQLSIILIVYLIKLLLDKRLDEKLYLMNVFSF